VLIGHDDFIAGLEEPLELKALDRLGIRPAALEVRRAVDPHVGRAVEREVVAQKLLDDPTIAGLVGAVGVADEPQPVMGRHVLAPHLVGSARVDL